MARRLTTAQKRSRAFMQLDEEARHIIRMSFYARKDELEKFMQQWIHSQFIDDESYKRISVKLTELVEFERQLGSYRPEYGLGVYA